MIRIFVGYDAREAHAFSVLSHSIHRHASVPVSITPLMLSQLGQVLVRPRDPLQSTDFAFSRFLVPYLCDYQGWALFMDCDMVMLDDVARLWKMRDDRFAVQVVKHVHVPTEGVKFLGQQQTRYAKKNWSSVMLFNTARCRALSPDYVNKAPGLDLHQFAWLESDTLIGELPPAWNHLVGYSSATGMPPSLVHFTVGGPYFDAYSSCDYSAEWRDEERAMMHVEQR